MAAAKKQSNRRGTAKTASGRKNTRKKQTRKQVKKQGVTSGFQTEIILLTILAASIILIISNLGMGGVVGAAISKASFGIMGLLAYVFPVLIFVGAAFLVSNSKNPLAYKKALAALVFFVFLCGLVQLLTEGYMSSTTMSEYYSTCSTYRTGGGVLGGAICISTTSAFGVAGGYVIIILVLLISLILITQKSFFGFVFRIWDAVCALARDGHDMYMEGQPERDLRKELRVQERRQRREERQAQRVRELEEALVQENNDGEEAAAKEKKSTGFLEGTLLVPPEAKKKKKYLLTGFMDLLDNMIPREDTNAFIDARNQIIQEVQQQDGKFTEAIKRKVEKLMLQYDDGIFLLISYIKDTCHPYFIRQGQR